MSKPKKPSRKIVSRPKKPANPLPVPISYDIAKALYNTPAYKDWREYILKRDEYKCQMCGKIGIALEVHHIRPKRLWPELTLVIDNGITLCKSCHQTIVTGREDRFAYIFSRIVKLNAKRLEIKLGG